LSRSKLLGVSVVAGALFVTSAGSTAAQETFLCPIVGDGVLNASAHGGVQAISPPAGTSILPGQNRAGEHANPNAYNAFGGPTAGNAPGTPGFTPIWAP
jgi:hypothetical protein